jgi:hypothetical protein
MPHSDNLVSKQALKRASGLDGAQGLNGVDEGAALGYDAVGEVQVITAHWRVHYGSVVAAGFSLFLVSR